MAKGHKLIAERFVVRTPYKISGEEEYGDFFYGKVRDTWTGKVHTVATRQKDKRRAEQQLIKWAEQEAKKQDPGSRKPNAKLFEKAFEEWLSLKSANENSIRDLKYCLTGVYLNEEKFKTNFVGKYVHEVLPIEIEKLLKELEEKKRKARTRQFHLSRLRSFFRWCVRNNYRKNDPTDGIKVPAGAKREGVALTFEEAQTLLNASREKEKVICHLKNNRTGRRKRKKWEQDKKPPSYLFLAMLISLHTGLRRGNVTGLRWSQIDFKQRKIAIAGDEMKARRRLEVPIHPELLEHLQAHLRAQEEKDGKVNPNGLVLGQEVVDVGAGFESVVRKVGMVDAFDKPTIRWHDLRHTVSTWLAIRYPQAIKDAMLGHAPRGVSGLYTHVQFEDLKKAIDAMPRLLPDAAAGAAQIPGAPSTAAEK